MLTFNLKKEWYERICSGEEKDYWHKRIFYALLKNNTMEEHFVCGVQTMASLDPTYCVLRLSYTQRLVRRTESQTYWRGK